MSFWTVFSEFIFLCFLICRFCVELIENTFWLIVSNNNNNQHILAVDGTFSNGINMDALYYLTISMNEGGGFCRQFITFGILLSWLKNRQSNFMNILTIVLKFIKLNQKLLNFHTRFFHIINYIVLYSFIAQQ